MKKFEVKKEFWNKFPKGQIEVLVIKGVDNSKADTGMEDKLRLATEHAKRYVTEDAFTNNQVISDWRSAFSSIKTKKGARSSIEALLKRVIKNQSFKPINPLVDIYNCISLEYGVPCGGEDINKIEGGLYLGEAKGGEEFIPIGTDESSPALETEMIYYDDNGVVCRSLNWREAKRTMLTSDTTDAVFVLEAVYPHQIENLELASKALKDELEEYFKVNVSSYSLTSETTEINLIHLKS